MFSNIITRCRGLAANLTYSESILQSAKSPSLVAKPRLFWHSSRVRAPRASSQPNNGDRPSKSTLGTYDLPPLPPATPTTAPSPPREKKSLDSSPFSSLLPGARRKPFTYDATKPQSLESIILGDLSAGHHKSLDSLKPQIRTKPSTGRVVHVQGTFDAARAVRTVNAQCRANKIQSLYHSQRFHERPGLKRKRLRRERWRVRFKEGFHATVQRARELKRQGW